MARRLTDGDHSILAELNADAAMSMSEQVADWAGVTVDDVDEATTMQFLDTMRQEAAEAWGTP
jgi:hypothetical protein